MNNLDDTDNTGNIMKQTQCSGLEDAAQFPLRPLPWANIKVRVITRAFYEDAYLDFFIKYYAALGFDTITILKADADKFEYTPPKLVDELCPNGNSPMVEIIPVVNEGNNIISRYYNYYSDKAFDWILNIDADEFLIIDLGKYPSGIKEFIYKLGHRIANTKNIPGADAIQQIKFRWMCINKLHNRQITSVHTDNIINNAILPDLSAQQQQQQLQILPQSFAGYFLTNKLELYKYIKSMSNTKWANSTKLINAHFFYPIPHANGRNYNLLDGYFKGVNNSNPRYFPNDGTMLMDGYILHLNTRSLANAITKCLVTQLRDNKKIKDPVVFQQLINGYTPLTSPADIHELKLRIGEQLNSKGFFPAKIRQFHKAYSKFIKPENWQTPLRNMLSSACNNIGGLIQATSVCNIDLEWQILRDLCVTNNLNPNNMRAIIELY